MKIISRGSLPENDVYRGTCGWCKTVFDCARHEGKFQAARDQRDEDRLVVPCPVCTKNVNAYKRNDGLYVSHGRRDYEWSGLADQINNPASQFDR